MTVFTASSSTTTEEGKKPERYKTKVIICIAVSRIGELLAIGCYVK